MRIQFTDDFDPGLIAESGQCFRWYALGDDRWRVLHGAHCLLLKQTGSQAYDLDCGEAEYDAVWRPYLDMDEGYAAIRERIEARALAEEQYEMRFAPTQFDEDEADEDFIEDKPFE